MAGSSGGGGGSSSGEVDYPEYQKVVHADWMGGGTYDTPSSMNTLDSGNDITSLLNLVIGNSPYLGESAYDPTSDINTQKAAIVTFNTNAQAAIDEFDAYVDDLENTNTVDNILGKFKAGMRDINAVNSSAFAIGVQIVASNLIELKVKAKQGVMASTAEKEFKVATLTVDVSRMSIIAFKEELEKNLKINAMDASWDLENFQVGANVLASISGGTVQKGVEGPSDVQSGIGGALSGMAAGASFTDGSWGGIIGGGILGAGASLL